MHIHYSSYQLVHLIIEYLDKIGDILWKKKMIKLFRTMDWMEKQKYMDPKYSNNFSPLIEYFRGKKVIVNLNIIANGIGFEREHQQLLWRISVNLLTKKAEEQG